MKNIKLDNVKELFSLDGNTWKIASQFLREFLAPLIFSGLWTWYDWDNSKTAFQMLSIGGIHFFAVGWVFSNWNRIKKQSKNEAGLSTIINKTEQLIENLSASTERLIGYNTGGDSFCEFMPTPTNPLFPKEFAIMHHGSYPLYDVIIRVVDIDRLTEFGSQADSENIYEFPILIPKHVRIVKLNSHAERIDPESPKRKYNIFVMARNGSSEQMFQMTLLSGFVRTATLIYRDAKVLLEDAAIDYPLDENGKIDWSEQELRQKFDFKKLFS